MNAFRFTLQRALEWRRLQLEMEEQNFRQQAAKLDAIDRASAEMTAAGDSAEKQIRVWNPVVGGELSALGCYRLHVKLKETELARTRAECRKELLRRENLMLEARRRVRLLERLREKRMEEWTEAQAKELEELAADAYLAKWKQRG